MADRVGQVVPAYTAQQCPICEGWFYVMDGPFAEGGDRTKPYSDFLHMEAEHADELDRSDGPRGLSFGIPYCSWNDEPVTITVTEAAILQGFPPDHPFQGSKTSQFRQVGNAVPPPVAAVVLAALINEEEDECAQR